MLSSNCERWRCSSMSCWTSKLVSGRRLTLMTHCCACGNAPLLFPLERPPVCDGMVHVKIGHLTNGQLSFPVVYVNCVYVCTWREKVMEGGKKAKEREKERVRKCLNEGKRLIHTAGTVVSSPASLALATVWSDTAAMDTLLGAASCWLETVLFVFLAGWALQGTFHPQSWACYIKSSW